MPQSVTALAPLAKGQPDDGIRPERALSEVFASRRMTETKLAAAWGVSSRVAARYLSGERPVTLERLGELPTDVQAEFYRRCLAQLEAGPTRHLEGEALDVSRATGHLAEVVTIAAADGVISPDEARGIRNAAAMVGKEAAEVARAAGQ